MFKAAIWRSEKNKIKVVFKLQFQAIQVLQLGRDALTISVVPVEVGKPTVKLEKAVERDGSCCWENPIYETVKFIREPKTGKFNEKIYKFIVSTASSKGNLVGEASIDLADYIETIKPLTVALPLKASNSGIILHVTIQRMQEAVDQREVEENEDLTVKSKERTLRSHFSTEKNGNSNSIENGVSHKSTHQNVESSGYVFARKVSDTTSASSSESSSERNTPRELGFKNNNNSDHRPANHSSTQRPTSKAFTLTYLEHQRSNTEWSVDSAPDGSTDDLPSSSEDSLTKERSPLASDASIEKLKSDIFALTRQAEVSDLELQTLRKQIVKESKRGQDLSREVLNLKEERDALKKECDQLKPLKKHTNDDTKITGNFHFENGDVRALLQELRQELNYEKELNVNLRVQLQKTQESNSELLLAVRDLDEMLEQKNREISSLSRKHVGIQPVEELQETVSKQETDDDEEQRALEQLVKEHGEAKEAYLLEQKIIDLYSEIDVYRRDRDELEMQMEQLALDYEILKQENHDLLSKLEQNLLQDQLKMQYECSASLANGNELEAQIESLEKDLNKKNEEFSASLATINELETQVENLENDLKKRNEEFSTSLHTIHELETQVESLEKDLKRQNEEFSTSLHTIHELETEVQSLEKDLKKRNKEFSASRNKEFSASLATINELETEVINLEKDLKKRNEEFSTSLYTIHDLETQVDGLEKELKKQNDEFSVSFSTIHELETQVKSLEKELVEQAQRFEADLEAVTNAKVEQEKRAIQAEEALRKTRWSNANTAERLQEEFRRLSVQMASTFEANEKLALKAVSESNELHLQNSHLEELLEKANEELGSAKEDYELKLKELSSQFQLAKNQVEQLSFELEEMSKKLEHQKINEQEMCEAFSEQIQMLRDEIERITKEKDRLSKEAEENEKLRVEMEMMKSSIDETEMLVLRGHVERDELESKIISVTKEAEKSLEELSNMRSLKEEKEKTVVILQTEVETLRTQYNDLKNSLFEDELEKENLRKQVFNLKGELQKKGDAVAAMEKKLKDSSGRAAVSDGTKPNSRNNKSVPLARGSKEVASLREKIKLLEGQIKLKEAALENSNNLFLEKEKDLLHKIEELENRMAEINQYSTCYCEEQLQMQVKDVDAMDVSSNSKEDEKPENMCDSQMGITEQLPIPNGIETAQTKSKKENGSMIITCNGCDQGQVDELQSEMEVLREKNKLMEEELKEMQERYSEISLKFAEVEGERQTLVMRVRNLKNAKKI